MYLEYIQLGYMLNKSYRQIGCIDNEGHLWPWGQSSENDHCTLGTSLKFYFITIILSYVWKKWGKERLDNSFATFGSKIRGLCTTSHCFSMSKTKESDKQKRFCMKNWGVIVPGGAKFILEIHLGLSRQWTHRRQWQLTPVLWPGKSHGWRSLVSCSPWGR